MLWRKEKMRLGIVTPLVNLNPRFDPPPWELAGGIDDIVAVAQAAERLGYDWVGCPEHVAIPTAVAATRGGRY
jgi:alkanesulfonate monooxygenase SsuD/methylene tetrahydromethanopterin reductase-like flavin-dependent oxidoreductase (luciferase family)